MSTLQQDIDALLGVGTPQVDKATLKPVIERIVDESVSFTEVQDKTEEEKQTARENIKAISLEDISGFIELDLQKQWGRYNDIGALISDSDYSYMKIDTNIYGKEIKATFRTYSPYMAGVCYSDSSDIFISSQYVESDFTVHSYSDVLLSIPTNCRYVYVTSYCSNKYDQLFLSVKYKDIRFADVSSLPKSRWNGKKAAWFGTSIPAGIQATGNDYPSMVAKSIGMTIYNEAIGGSKVTWGDYSVEPTGQDPLGIRGCNWASTLKSLSASIAEKQTVFSNWEYYKTVLGTDNGIPVPDSISEADQLMYCSYSWDDKLLKHFNNSVQPVDLFIFDHGHNDTPLVWDERLFATPADKFDRRYFIGAMNFLIDKILNNNPKARICFIGHYEDARKDWIKTLQLKIAGIWSFSIGKTWEKTGWTQNTVSTSKHWIDGYLVDGGQPQELTLTQYWMEDDLHPFSDLSKSANEFLADIHTQFIDTVI